MRSPSPPRPAGAPPRGALALLLLGLALLIGLIAPGPRATAEPGAPAAPAGHPLGWTAGTPAAATAEVLAPAPPAVVDLPAALAAQITGDTALFYFSPRCPHCRNVMPEIVPLAQATAAGGAGAAPLRWIGVATSSSTADDVAAFAADFDVPFPLLLDADGAFGQQTGARSTPTVYLARPLPPGASSPGQPPEGMVPVQIFDAYSPYTRGTAGLLQLRRDPRGLAGMSGYQGQGTCRACHAEEGLSMAITHHAAALYTLHQQGKHEDPACVRCHVTGLGEPGGFRMGDLGHPLGSVQCESCHGPSGPHDGISTDARASCVGCHDKDHSIAFSVEKGLPHIDHFAANRLSLDALQARLAAIQDGSAEKPLLAFPDGPTAGAAACASCHKAEHKWHLKADHGRAMATLTDKGQAEDPACVRCHATPRAYGLGAPRQSLADYRLDEGVGCETCHGPGGAHAANPTADNIVGLGESCPVCVIEAVCTSCHTPEQDKDWALEPALKAVRHGG